MAARGRGRRVPAAGLFLWFVAIGLFTGYLPVLIAHGKSLFPPQLVGRGITLLNMGDHGRRFLSSRR